MLEKKIFEDYIHAIKAKDTLKSATLNFLRAQLKNISIDKKVKNLDDSDVVAVIKKQVKQRQDSIEQFEKGDRQDLAQKERQELEILKSYLPPELSTEKIQVVIEQTITETGAVGMKDMGAVMKAVASKLAGQADNKTISDLVKKALS